MRPKPQLNPIFHRSPSGSISAMTGSGKMIRPAPAEIEFKNMRFLITEQPQDHSIQVEIL